MALLEGRQGVCVLPPGPPVPGPQSLSQGEGLVEGLERARGHLNTLASSALILGQLRWPSLLSSLARYEEQVSHLLEDLHHYQDILLARRQEVASQLEELREGLGPDCRLKVEEACKSEVTSFHVK